ncbi:MAG: C25 family cysteine peptidase [candidate division WOR-3 bacterium]
MPDRMLGRLLAVLSLLLAGAGLLPAQTGARYLIITHDNFYNAIQPLAQWKQQKGMQCVVVKTSQIGSTNASIRNYILNAYNTWNPRPEFVLLVGNGYYLPAFSVGWQQFRIYSDNSYGNMAGDYRVELPYGRFPCRTVRQCSVMVAKTLAYERNPDLSDTTWYRQATAVIRDSGDSDAYTYWSDARFMAGLMQSAGYSNVESICSSRHQTAADVVSAVNQGRSFVLYRGTATNNWYTPFAVNPSQTSNGKRLPIICSFTCETVTLNSTDSMVGDAWMRVGTPTSLTGAVAFVGNTHSASHVAGRRSSMTRGFFTGLFTESLATLGAATLRGKNQIYNDWRDSMEYYGFNLLGDPELNVWTTTPQSMTVSFDSVIAPGLDSFLVTVERAGRPVSRALVCVQGGPDSVYQYGYTDATGQCRLVFNTTQEGLLALTVTARNCRPVETQVAVGQLAIGEQSKGQRPLQPVFTPNPAREVIQVNCPARAEVRLLDPLGRLVRSVPARAQAGLKLDVRDLAPGIYVLETRTAGRANRTPVVILR